MSNNTIGIFKWDDKVLDTIRVKLDSNAFPPISAHDADAGYDIRTPIDFVIPDGGCAVIDTGVHIEIPRGYVGFLKSKSGLNVRNHLTGEGVIDSGYTCSVVVKLYSHRRRLFMKKSPGKIFRRGDKIIQLVLLPIVKPDIQIVDELTPTERGDGGFGSTGK